MTEQRFALISVSDKTGLPELAQVFKDFNIALVGSSGTAKALAEWQIPALPVENLTQFPEMLDGRVKTLHPKVHGGILYRRFNSVHARTALDYALPRFDFVVVNLYPFAETTANPEASLVDIVEKIDIGGPALLRSAAKNHESVTVVVDPADYTEVSTEIRINKGDTSLPLRVRLATKVFEHTAHYDAFIADWMKSNMRRLSGFSAGPLLA